MASTKIRGITIELGADTSGLSKALKDINSDIGKTAKDLKDVEKLLKLDPKNTELLEQKQRLLNDRIGETKTKLEALKTAQSQVDLSTEEGQRQYDALTREIASCEAELKQLEAQASKSQEAIRKIGEAGEKMKDLGGKVKSVGDDMTRHVTVPVVAAGAGIVKVAGDFEEQMAKVSGIAQAYGDDLDSLKTKALDLSESTRFSATEIGQAYEYMGMAGWNTNQILAGTPGILDLATASGEDLAQVSDIVTDGLTAFGLKAEDTTRFVNVLAEAARSSNTNVGMMGEAFKYVGPVAGSMGYSIEDVAVAMGTMANSGIKASMAGTTLRNILTNMSDPSDKMQSAMDRLGLSLADDEGKMYSLEQIMQQLRVGMTEINMPLEEYNRQLDQLDEELENGTLTEAKYEKALEELNKEAFGAEGAEKARAASMLGGKRAMAGMLAIANATDEEYKELRESIEGSSDTMVKTADGSVKTLTEALADGDEILEQYNGTAAAMAGTMNDTANVHMKQFQNKVQNLGIQFGETLLPKLEQVIDKLSELLESFKDLTPEQQDAIVNFALFAAAIGPVLSVIGRLMTGFGSILTAVPKVSKGFSTISGGISKLIPSITSGLSSLGTFLTADLGTTIAAGGTAAVGTALSAVVASIASFFAGAELGKKIGGWIFPDDADLYAHYSGISGTLELLKDTAITFGERTAEHVTNAWNGIKTATSEMATNAKTEWTNFKTGVQMSVEDVKTFAGKCKESFTNLKDGVKSAMETAGESVKSKVESINTKFGEMKDKIQTSVGDAKSKIADFKSNVSEKLTDAGTKIANFNKTVTDKFNSIKDSVIKCFEAIKNGIKSPINGAIGFVEKFINNMIDGFNKLGNKIGSLSFDVPDWVPEIGGKSFKIGLPELSHISLPKLAQGGILTSGTAMVGEAGPEMLSVKNGQAIVQPLGGTNGAAELTGLLETYLPYLAMRQNILLDGNTLVGQTASRMNDALGSIALRSARR